MLKDTNAHFEKYFITNSILAAGASAADVKSSAEAALAEVDQMRADAQKVL